MRLLSSVIAGLLISATLGLAAAAQVPASVMPGRERDRFTESPVERFMRPGPFEPPRVIEPAAGGCTKSRHVKPRSGKQKGC
jgi:hypothetical protein